MFYEIPVIIPLEKASLITLYQLERISNNRDNSLSLDLYALPDMLLNMIFSLDISGVLIYRVKTGTFSSPVT